MTQRPVALHDASVDLKREPAANHHFITFLFSFLLQLFFLFLLPLWMKIALSGAV